MLHVNRLGMHFCAPDGGCREVLRDITFDLAGDETLAVIGPSGCGKTTLLYLLCGLMEDRRGRGRGGKRGRGAGGERTGEVVLDGTPVTAPSTDIAIILQDYGLLPWKTALQNVTLGLKVQGVPRRERDKAGRALLAAMGLAGREADYPSNLSGGEQQRVAIARAYALRPKLLLMDEPFSSLDAITRESLQRTLLDARTGELGAQAEEGGMDDAGTEGARSVPYILVTHSVEEAVYLGRRILLMAGSPATVAATFDNPGFGDPDYRDRPEYFERVREVRKAMERYW